MKKHLVLILILLMISFTWAQNPGVTGSGYSFFHTFEGRVLNPGYLDVYVNSNFFSQKGKYLGNPPEDFQVKNWWLVAGNIAFSYGIIEHLDISAAIRVYQRTYQDTSYSNQSNVPDDIFLTLKGGSFKFARRHFSAAIQSTVRIPSGKTHNYPFTEYASGALEYGFMGMISYYADSYFPNRAFNFHYNFGLWFHNEEGKEIPITGGEKRTASVNSSRLGMAVAFIKPIGAFDLRLELAGFLYLQEPDSFIYSAEDLAYLTPSIRYKPLDWLSLDLGMDFRLSPGDRQRTLGVPDVSNRLNLPTSYPPWKVQLGLHFKALPKGRKPYDSDIINLRTQRALDEYNRIIKETEKAKKEEGKVRDLRQERKSVDEEIDGLKKEIEG